MSKSSPDPTVVQEIREIFRTKLQVAVESDETDLIAEGLLDSLELVDLLLALEERFDVEVRMDEIEFDDFRTVHSIAGWVARETGGSVTDAGG